MDGLQERAERLRLRVLAGGRGRDEPPPPPDPEPPGSWLERAEGWRGALLLAAALVVVRLVVAALPGLAADEAYYWAWGQAPAWGYLDHPPGVAWLVRASTDLFGHGELGVRALGVLLGAAALAVLAWTSRRPWLSVAAAASLPLFALGGLLATPDVPLIFGWALALAGVVRGGRWWLLAGLGLGLAVLGKHTGLLLFPLLLLARPREWRTRWPWLGFGLALLVLAPHVAWLAQHDWVTLRFQAGHGLGVGEGAVEGRPGLGGLGAYLAGQVGLVSPLLMLCFGAFWAVGWLEKGIVRLWWWLSFPVFAFFALASLFARSEANWAAPAYLAASLGLAHLSTRWRRVAWVGVGMAAVASALAMAHAVRPVLPIQRDPTLSLVGGRILAEAVEAWGIEPVYTARYQEAAWIRFYGGIDAEVLPGSGRPNQFDLWAHAAVPARALFVRPWRRAPPRQLDPYWAHREGPNTVVAPDALLRQAGRWQVYVLDGYRGGLFPSEAIAGSP
ncbi:MAG: glycosyltransferase family 39 protein [Pseudomonadota bacterium]